MWLKGGLPLAQPLLQIYYTCTLSRCPPWITINEQVSSIHQNLQQQPGDPVQWNADICKDRIPISHFCRCAYNMTNMISAAGNPSHSSVRTTHTKSRTHYVGHVLPRCVTGLVMSRSSPLTNGCCTVTKAVHCLDRGQLDDALNAAAPTKYLQFHPRFYRRFDRTDGRTLCLPWP